MCNKCFLTCNVNTIKKNDRGNIECLAGYAPYEFEFYLLQILFVYIGFIHFVLLCKLILFIYLYQSNYCLLYLKSYCN